MLLKVCTEWEKYRAWTNQMSQIAVDQNFKQLWVLYCNRFWVRNSNIGFLLWTWNIWILDFVLEMFSWFISSLLTFRYNVKSISELARMTRIAFIVAIIPLLPSFFGSNSQRPEDYVTRNVVNSAFWPFNSKKYSSWISWKCWFHQFQEDAYSLHSLIGALHTYRGCTF